MNRYIVALMMAPMWLATACATTPATVEPPPTTGTLLQPGIYRVADGAEVPAEVFFDDLEQAKVVYVGETHDNAAHHMVQTAVLEELSRRAPGKVGLGMEMFHRPFQSVLDDYARSQIDEETMLERAEYEERWGFDFGFYRPMMTLMRLQGSPIAALNAPKELTRKISREGLDALNEAEKAQIPPSFHEDNPPHREMFKQAMGSFHHGMDEATFERFYHAQVMWDSTMAMSAVQCFERHPQLARLVVVAGMYHVQQGLGIPFHVEKQAGFEGRIVIPAQFGGEEPVYAEDIIGSDAGDYIWVYELPEGSQPSVDNPHEG